MKIFWSWQSDVSPQSCRSFIRQALVDAITLVNLELDVDDAERPEIDHDTKDEPGMVDIPATVLKKISAAACFVADMTPIAKTDAGKAVANPNVCIELGWAMQTPGFEHIIAVMNLAGGWKIEDRPFDIKQRRIITYTLPEGAPAETVAKQKKQLVQDLSGALKTNLAAQIEARAASTAIKGVEASASDPSIWATAKPVLTYFDDRGRKSVPLVNGPRAYLRIIPAAWKAGPPSVTDIRDLPDHMKVWPPTSGGSSGDFGACEEGFVNFWYTDRDDGGNFVTGNVVCFFDQSGEFWFLDGSAIKQASAKKFLAIDSLMRGWQSALRSSMLVLNQFGALPTRKVECGLTGLDGVLWPGDTMTSQPMARKPTVRLERQRRDWGEEAQLEVLLHAYNSVRDVFALQRVDGNKLRPMLNLAQ